MYTPIPQDEACSLIGEGVHTGLRKAAQGPDAGALWKMIDEDLGSWSDALAFAVSGLESMGYAICRKEPEAGVREDGVGIAAEVVRDLLLLVDQVTPMGSTIESWSQAERQAVVEWARAVHLAASDNDVEIPPLPEVLSADEHA